MISKFLFSTALPFLLVATLISCEEIVDSSHNENDTTHVSDSDTTIQDDTTVVDTSGNNDTTTVGDTGTVAQKYFFEYCYENGAWGSVLKGTYINSDGYVINYNYGPEAWRWQPANYDTLTLAELEDKYHSNIDTITQVSSDTLASMLQKIEPASNGPWSEDVNVAADAGEYSFLCYQYDTTSNTYIRILLDKTGDWEQTNEAQEAIALTQWLDSLINPVIP